MYLKYRQQRIEDLDLVSVRETLGKYLASGKWPHAWLFSGPRGTGKTSSARIFAKAINCSAKDKVLSAKDFEPCNECGMCKAITAGTAVDVVEIDAASNRGIDEIRELKEKIRLAPMQAKYKVYIIDEVHMLTTEAANALLKTLEEPPGNTVFILCTTEPDKLLPTVISRCTRVVFTKPVLAELVSSLKRVADGEKYKYKQEALEELAKAAGGSFRDGIKLLEQVATDNGQITITAVEKVLGTGAGKDTDDLLAAVKAGDRTLALNIIKTWEEKGVNFRRVTENLARLIRQDMLEKAQGKDVAETKRFIGWLEGLDRVYDQMKIAVITQLPLEIWVIENCGEVPPVIPETINTSPRPSPNLGEGDVVKGDQKTRGLSNNLSSGKYKLADLTEKWGEIMKAVRPKNHSVEALLRSTRPMDFDGQRMELEVFYKFHKDKLETDKCRQIVEEAVELAMGVSGVKLFLKLGEKIRPNHEEVTADGVGEDIVKAAEEIFKVQAV